MCGAKVWACCSQTPPFGEAEGLSRRCLPPSHAAPLAPGYTFLYPAQWLADQTLYRRYAERIERQAALDPPSLRGGRTRRAGGGAEPTAAFGPAGSTGEENISVVVAPIRDGFTLQRMGTPEEAATRFLETTGGRCTWGARCCTRAARQPSCTCGFSIEFATCCDLHLDLHAASLPAKLQWRPRALAARRCS